MTGVAAVGVAASVFGARKAGKQADAALAQSERSRQDQLRMQEKQLELSQEQLDYNMYQQQLWNNTYGAIETNLQNYYKELDPGKFQAEMNVDISEYYNKAKESITANLASRGIQGSGIEAQALTDLEMGKAESLAQTGFRAEEQVAGMQSNFLASGKGRQAQIESNIQGSFGTQMGAYGSAVGLHGQQAQASMNLAGQYGASEAGYMQAAGSFLSRGIQGYSKGDTVYDYFNPSTKGGNK